ACAPGVEDLDLGYVTVSGRVKFLIGPVLFGARFPGQIPGGIDIEALEVDRGSSRSTLPDDDSGIAIIMYADEFSLHREGSPGCLKLGAIVQHVVDTVGPNELRSWYSPASERLGAKQGVADDVGF